MTAVHPEHPIADGDTAEIKAMVFRQLDAHSSIRERVASLEESVRHSATKADVAHAKIWALSGIVGTFLVVMVLLVKLAFFT